MEDKNISKYVLAIRKFRVDRKMTQKQLADKLTLTRRQYQRMENGNMPLWVLEEAAEVLGLKLLLLDKEVLK